MVETSGRTWYFKKMQGNHRHIVAILMGGLRCALRPCGGAVGRRSERGAALRALGASPRISDP